MKNINTGIENYDLQKCLDTFEEEYYPNAKGVFLFLKRKGIGKGRKLTCINNFFKLKNINISHLSSPQKAKLISKKYFKEFTAYVMK
ncbi:MAG: hypothetical protein GY775_14620 [Candidatus Scalindua sp.]|nr:hypothetical protein [Candidatus Scalindua sp.]